MTHQTQIYRQDPSSEFGVAAVTFPPRLFDGPTDDRVTTALPGATPVMRDPDGHFLFEVGTPEFDCVHAFSVVRLTLDMFDELNGSPVGFQWGTERITVMPYAQVSANAVYSREARAVAFGSFLPTYSMERVYTCRSVDVVAHETGHAVLDGLKPGWLGNGVPQTGALHEAFGDLTAIFLTLRMPGMAEAVITATGGDLHSRSFLSEVAELLGTGLGLPYGLRNADNDLTLDQVGTEVHALSQVFTGAVYDVLADVFTFTAGPAEALRECAEDLSRLLLDAIKASPAGGTTYADVAHLMVELADEEIYRTAVRDQFTRRGVLIP